jgi:hypothetical protein
VAGAGAVDEDAGAVSVLERFERGLRIRVNRRNRRRGPRLHAASGEAFDLADTHAAAGNTPCELEALFGICNGQKGAAMPGREAAFFDQVLDHGFELQKAQRVGDCGAVFSGALGDVLLGEVEFVGETLKGARLFDRIQVLALQVFDERHLERDFLGDLANDDGNARERRPLGGAPAAFTGDQLVAKPNPPDYERLDDTAGTNRPGELLESLFAKAGTRLIGARVDEIDVELQQNVIRCWTRGWGHCRCCCCSRRPRRRLLLRMLLRRELRFPDQGAQSPPQGVSGHWR